MYFYKYKAMDEKGRIHNGQIEAMNIADLETRLNRLGFDLINYKESRLNVNTVFVKAIQKRDLITFCFHLEQTSQAGIPILDSLQDLRDSADNPRLVEVINVIIEDIKGGKTLSESMAQFKSVFSGLFISLIRVGEQSGEMGQIFKKLGESLKFQDEQVSQTKKLLMYPAFVGIVVMAVVFFLMTYLVPELLKFVKMAGQELPLHTRALIFISNIFVNYWYIILLIPICIIFCLYIGVKASPDFHTRCDSIKLKLPIIGAILKKIILARLSNFFAIMYASGITIIDCIRMGEEIVDNRAMAEVMRQVGQRITDGKTLSDSFESIGLFPPLVLRMIRVGETTGALKESLLNVSYFYIRDVRESIEYLQAMIEPVMTIILGVTIAWIMFSVLGPVYDLITQIKV